MQRIGLGLAGLVNALAKALALGAKILLPADTKASAFPYELHRALRHHCNCMIHLLLLDKKQLAVMLDRMSALAHQGTSVSALRLVVLVLSSLVA